MFKLVIAVEFENLPGFTALNYVLMHMHHLLPRSLLQADQNLKHWSGFLQLSPICRISCEIPLLRGVAQAIWSTSCCPEHVLLSVVNSRCVSSLACLAWVAPTWDVPLLIAPAMLKCSFRESYYGVLMENISTF